MVFDKFPFLHLLLRLPSHLLLLIEAAYLDGAFVWTIFEAGKSPRPLVGGQEVNSARQLVQLVHHLGTVPLVPG